MKSKSLKMVGLSSGWLHSDQERLLIKVCEYEGQRTSICIGRSESERERASEDLGCPPDAFLAEERKVGSVEMGVRGSRWVGWKEGKEENKKE